MSMVSKGLPMWNAQYKGDERMICADCRKDIEGKQIAKSWRFKYNIEKCHLCKKCYDKRRNWFKTNKDKDNETYDSESTQKASSEVKE